jgi:biotin synthase
VAGANSLFIGEKLLTTPNPEPEDDAAMLQALGLEPLPLR